MLTKNIFYHKKNTEIYLGTLDPLVLIFWTAFFLKFFLLQISGQTGSKYTPLTPDLRSCSQLSGLAQSVTVEGWFSGPSTEWCVRVMRGCHVYLCIFIYLPTTYPIFGVFLKVMTGYCANNTSFRQIFVVFKIDSCWSQKLICWTHNWSNP